jgi:hypothetical protein
MLCCAVGTLGRVVFVGVGLGPWFGALQWLLAIGIRATGFIQSMHVTLWLGQAACDAACFQSPSIVKGWATAYFGQLSSGVLGGCIAMS